MRSISKKRNLILLVICCFYSGKYKNIFNTTQTKHELEVIVKKRTFLSETENRYDRLSGLLIPYLGFYSKAATGTVIIKFVDASN